MIDSVGLAELMLVRDRVRFLGPRLTVVAQQRERLLNALEELTALLKLALAEAAAMVPAH